MVREGIGQDKAEAVYASRRIYDDWDDVEEILAVAVRPGTLDIFHLRAEPRRQEDWANREYQTRSVRIPLRTVAAVTIQLRASSRQEYSMPSGRVTILSDALDVEAVEIRLAQDLGGPVGNNLGLPVKSHALGGQEAERSAWTIPGYDEPR